MLSTLFISLMRLHQSELSSWLPLLKRSYIVELRRFLVILSIVLVLVLTIVAWFFPSNDDFRAENPFWNGTRDISSSCAISPLRFLSDLVSQTVC